MKHVILSFIRDESGAAAAEYALILAIVGAGIALAAGNLGKAISTAINTAQGQAAAFDAFYEQYKLAPEVTRRRMYYETMEAILAKNDKMIIEPRNIAPFLPLAGAKKLPDAPQAEAR